MAGAAMAAPPPAARALRSVLRFTRATLAWSPLRQATAVATQRVVDDLGVAVVPDAVKLRGVTGTALAAAVKVDTLAIAISTTTW